MLLDRLKIYSFKKDALCPPYRLVPLGVFLVILFYFFYNPLSPLYTFRLADPDDYMRLNETINWLQWADWFDLSHPRLAPGVHTVLHWSRLLDVPLAAIMKPFLKEWGYRSSAMLAALIEPLFLLAALLVLIPAMARPILGRGKAKVSVLFVPFAPWLFFNFTPGRVDHHNWEILIAGIGLMGLHRMVLCRGGWKAGIFAAIAFALGLWISVEIMPCLVFVLGCLALFSALRGGFTLQNAAIFGVAFAATTTAILPAAVPVTSWNDLSVSWFSLAYVIFAGLTGVVFVVAWLLARYTPNKALRVLLFAVIGALAASLFFYIVPAAWIGPFADFDDFNATIALDNINEAIPLSRAFHIDFYNRFTWVNSFVGFFRIIFPTLVAVIISICMAARSHTRRRMVWAIYAIGLLGTFLLALFFQSRVLWFAQLFQIAPLTYIVFKEARRRSRFIVPIIAFLVLGPLSVWAIPYVATQLVTAPEKTSSCNLSDAMRFIAGPWGYMSHAYTILASEDDGPEILFRSPHNVIAANFNVPSNKDVFDFFNARDEVEPMSILRKWNVGLVLVCRNIPPFYAGMNHPRFGKNAFLKMQPDGRLHMVSSPTTPSFIEKLVNGAQPDCLKPVEIPTTNDYLLFEVHLPRVKK